MFKTSRKKHTVKLIEQIVESLNFQDEESRNLWYVLTALRGPDNEGSALKAETTAKLRRAIGLNASIFAIVSNENPPESHRDYDVVTRELSKNNSFIRYEYHFVNHYALGVRALLDLGIIKKDKN